MTRFFLELEITRRIKNTALLFNRSVDKESVVGPSIDHLNNENVRFNLRGPLNIKILNLMYSLLCLFFSHNNRRDRSHPSL